MLTLRRVSVLIVNCATDFTLVLGPGHASYPQASSVNSVKHYPNKMVDIGVNVLTGACMACVDGWMICMRKFYETNTALRAMSSCL